MIEMKSMTTMTLFDWEQRKFESLIYPEKIKNKNNLQLRAYSISNKNGFIAQTDQFGKDNTYSKADKKTNYIVNPGAFAYNPARINVGSIGYQNLATPVLVSSLYEVFKTNSQIKDLFLIYWFKTDKFFNQIKKYEEGGVRQYYFLDKLLFSEIIIPKDVREQQKISKILKKLDYLISLQQRKLKQLDLLKKAMLQQILTTNDYPKIRFRGFTNVWDQRRLEKIAKITTGKLDANAMVKNGKYDFYTSGIKKFKINTAAFEGPAITIAGNGATVGYMHLADGKFNAYQRTYVLNQFTVNRLFLFYSVKKVLPRSIYQSARTGNIPYIVLNMITDLKVNVPKEKEQKKIGELFTEIQAILINQKNRLRCIKDLKQYLLQNIFL